MLLDEGGHDLSVSNASLAPPAFVINLLVSYGIHLTRAASHTCGQVGVEYGLKSATVRDQNIQIEIWDTAGQEAYMSLTNRCVPYEGTVLSLPSTLPGRPLAAPFLLFALSCISAWEGTETPLALARPPRPEATPDNPPLLHVPSSLPVSQLLPQRGRLSDRLRLDPTRELRKGVQMGRTRAPVQQQSPPGLYPGRE